MKRAITIVLMVLLVASTSWAQRLGGGGIQGGSATLPANIVQSAGTLTTGQTTCTDAEGKLVSCGAPVTGFGDVATGAAFCKAGATSVGACALVEKIAVFNFDGAAADNTVIDSYIPAAMTITGWMITNSGAACAAVVDIWNDSYANFPPTVADTIAASAKPTLSTAQKNKDTTLTGWTKTLAADSFLRANLDSSDCTGTIQITIFGTR